MQFHVHDIVLSDTIPRSSNVSHNDLQGEEYLVEYERVREIPSQWALTVCLFGRTAAGASVCVVVPGFMPELYYDDDISDDAIVAAAGGNAMRDKIVINRVTRFDAGDLILDDDGYRLPRKYKQVAYRTLFAYRKACYSDNVIAHHTKPTLESKFCRRTGIKPEGWVKVDLALTVPSIMATVSHCDFEFHAKELGAVCGVECDEYAPQRIMAFDIEAVSEKEEFPEPTDPDDVVCQISIVMYTMGTLDATAPRRFLICLRGCSPIEGTTVLTCSSEVDVLLRMRDVIIKEDPDWIMQYNGFGFDIRYLEKRSEILGCADAFALQSRLKFERCRFLTKKMKSGARGDQELKYYTIPGRSNFDLMHWYMQNYKKASYALDDVAYDEIGQNKVEFSYKLIKPYYHGTDGQRREMGVYCVQDAELLCQLAERLKCFGEQMELSRVSGVIVERLVTHGQSIKVTSQMNQQCTRMPASERYGNHEYIMDNHNIVGESIDEGFEGATVVEPVTGYYKEKAVLVMDFSSLYPSIMIAENLCKSTLVRRKEDFCKPGVVRHQLPTGDVYFSIKNKGIIPMMLEETLTQRSIAKNEKARVEARLEELDQTDCPERRSLLQLALTFDKRQLALKVSANSAYGFLGAVNNGGYGDKDVAAAVTTSGRQMLEESYRICEKKSQSLTRRSDDQPVGQLKLVYGDSVANYTPLLVRIDGRIAIVTPEELWDTATLVTDVVESGKQGATLRGVSTWTISGWTSVTTLIRHRITKPMFRVATHTGVVDVTSDHSLLRPDGTPCTAQECMQEGGRLLHAWPPQATVDRAHADDIDLVRARIYGFFVGDGDCGACKYDTSKYSWALNNHDYDMLEQYRVDCERVFGIPFDIIDTMASSHVYKLVPVGGLKGMASLFGATCYGPDRLKKVPDEVLNGGEDLHRAFVTGLYDADGARDCDAPDNLHTRRREWQAGHFIDQQSERVALGLFYILRALDFNVSIGTRDDEEHMYRVRWTTQPLRKDPYKIKKCKPLSSYAGEYVFDLTTANHHFHAGVGDLSVHNTDSLMVTLENVDNPQDGWHAGVEMSGEVTGTFASRGEKKKKLEMEKCFQPWILFSKKKYAGIKWDEDKDGNIVSRGVSHSGTVSKRRDNCLLVKHMYDDMIDALLYESDREKCIERFHHHMTRLINNEVSYDDLVITKAIQSSYKNYNLAQCKVVAKQKHREPGSETKSGSRLGMIYVEGKKGDKVGDLAEDVNYARQHKLRPDVLTYIQSQLQTPALQLLQLLNADAMTTFIKPYLSEARRLRSNTPRIADFLSAVRPQPATKPVPVADSSEERIVEVEAPPAVEAQATMHRATVNRGTGSTRTAPPPPKKRKSAGNKSAPPPSGFGAMGKFFIPK